MDKNRYFRFMLFTGVLVLLTGCNHKVPQPTLPKAEQKPKKERVRWGDSSRYSAYEEHYKLKPEPFSLDSNQKDPELLGPQSTVNRTQNRVTANEVYDTTPTPKPAVKKGVSKSECIDMLGYDKFNSYAKKYGSEAAAIRRCNMMRR